MLSLTNRNLKIYLNNRLLVFFSMMAALISFGLFLIFLRQSMLTSFTGITGAKQLLDTWLIGGTLTVTALTTTGVGVTQIVRDRETKRLDDLRLTDLNQVQITAGYLVSAVLIGMLAQLVAYVVMTGYFQFTDSIHVDWGNFGLVVMVMLLNSVVWTAFNLLIYSFINRVQSISAVNSILGTASGFFAGVYVPISLMPAVAQTVMKCTPAPYISALFRQLLMHDQLTTSFHKLPQAALDHFRLTMGIDLKWNDVLSTNQLLLVLLGFFVLFLILMIPINRFNHK